MRSFVAQDLTFLHPEKVNRLILYAATSVGKDAIAQKTEVVKVLSDFVNNRQMDLGKLLSVTFPPEWIKSHLNNVGNIPKPKEILTPNILKQQFSIVEDWYATDSSGVCSQLPKIMKPTLAITGTEDISVPAANSLIVAEKLLASCMFRLKEMDMG